MKRYISGLLLFMSVTSFAKDSPGDVAFQGLKKILKNESLLKCKSESRGARAVSNSCREFADYAEKEVEKIKKDLDNAPEFINNPSAQAQLEFQQSFYHENVGNFKTSYQYYHGSLHLLLDLKPYALYIEKEIKDLINEDEIVLSPYGKVDLEPAW